MCILRYLPTSLPSRSNTTAVLWYSPGARRSNSEPTSTIFNSLASLPRRSLDGPGIGSARLNSSVLSCWQKYTLACSSWSITSFAPAFAALRMPASLAFRFFSRSVPQDCCTRPTFRIFLDIDLRGLRDLHRHAMKAAILVNEGAAINADHLTLREAGSQALERDVVGGGAVGRHQHGAVHDQEVRVAGGQAAAVVISGRWQGQRHQLVGLVERIPERGELVGHRPQI